MASYKADRAAVPFKSGTSEEHTKWQQIMEEIFELTGDENLNEVAVQQDQQELRRTEKDMQAAGELLRGGQLDNFVKKVPVEKRNREWMEVSKKEFLTK